jgi:hypothetical protein
MRKISSETRTKGEEQKKCFNFFLLYPYASSSSAIRIPLVEFEIHIYHVLQGPLIIKQKT